MQKEEVLVDEYVKQWFNEIEAEPSTRAGYVHTFYLFTQFTGKTPKELIEDAEEEIRKGVPLRRQNLKRYLPDFAHWVEEDFRQKYGREIAPKTLKDRIAGVRSFYQAFEIQVPRNMKKLNRAETLPENLEIPTIEMVQEALNVASIRDRALLLTMLGSGFGDSEVLGVRIRDVMRGRGYDPHLIGRNEIDIRRWIGEEKRKVNEAIDAEDLNYGITTIKSKRKKTGVLFFSCLTPEATLAILDYLEWRNREPKYENYRGRYHKGMLTSNYEKRKIRNVNDYVFIRNNIPDDFLPLDVLKEIYEGSKSTEELYECSKLRRQRDGDRPYEEDGRVLKKGGLTRVFRELARKIGVDTDWGKWQVLRGHGLRKLFNSQLLNDGCPVKMVEFWMGHKLPEHREAYYRASETELREHYAKHMHALFTGRIEIKRLKSEEFKVIEQELRAKDDSIINLKTEMEKLMKASERSTKFMDKFMTLVAEDPEVMKKFKKFTVD